MCKICDKTYDDNTTELICCQNVTEIPVLPKLKELWCYLTNITKIPVLPKLEILYCDNTNITKIPVLPKLERLYCSNTKITEIPLLPKLKVLDCTDTKITEIPLLPKLEILWCSNTNITALPKITNCYIEANNCVWVNPTDDRINKLIVIQKWVHSSINKRTKIIHAAMHTYRDLAYVLNV